MRLHDSFLDGDLPRRATKRAAMEALEKSVAELQRVSEQLAEWVTRGGPAPSDQTADSDNSAYEDALEREVRRLKQHFRFTGRAGSAAAAFRRQAAKNLRGSGALVDLRLDRQFGPRVVPRRTGGTLDGVPVADRKRKRSPKVL